MQLPIVVTSLFALLFCGNLIGQSAEVVAAYNLGVAAAKAKNHNGAIEHYSEALKIDPLYSQGYYSRGIAKVQLKEYQAAVVDFKKCLKLNEENAKAHYYAGFCLMNMKQNQEAIKSFSRALQKDPSLTMVYYYRAKIQMQDGNYQRAIRDFNESIVKKGNDDKTAYQLGVCYLKTDQPEAAKQAFGQALEANADYVPALTEKLKLDYKSSDYSQVLTLASQLLKVEPGNSVALYYQAMSKLKSEDYDEAYLAFGDILKADPTNLTALKNKAFISLKNKDYEAAIRDQTALIAVEQEPKHYLNRSLSYMQVENWALALEDLNQVVKLDPDYAEAYYNRSNVHLQMEQQDLACNDMRQAVRLGYDEGMSYVVGLCGN